MTLKEIIEKMKNDDGFNYFHRQLEAEAFQSAIDCYLPDLEKINEEQEEIKDKFLNLIIPYISGLDSNENIIFRIPENEWQALKNKSWEEIIK